MLNFEEIKSNLTHEDIIKIIEYFFPDIDYIEKEDCLILPTICHNEDPIEASKKLYYYDNSKLFFCYTECNESFDIFDLVKKILTNQNLDNDFSTVIKIISHQIDTNKFFTFEKEEDLFSKYKQQKGKISLPQIDENILNIFPKMYPKTWIEEGITIQSMEKYGIRVCPYKEQIIIPHKDIKGSLIGIRVRNLSPLMVENGNKYMPAKINGVYYNHPLMYNLYGLYENQKAITKTRSVWIFEGEKSCLKCDGWYGDRSIAVASCGDKVNKIQLNLLLQMEVKEITICYDRMNFNKKSSEEYFKKLYQLCKKYSNFANFYFVFDRKMILDYKSAPVDSGQEIFEKMLGDKIKV